MTCENISLEGHGVTSMANQSVPETGQALKAPGVGSIGDGRHKFKLFGEDENDFNPGKVIIDKSRFK